MFDMPMDYKAQSFVDFFNMQPSEVKGRWNTDTEYQKRYLWYMVYSSFDIKLPEDWALNWFRFWAFRCGSIAVIYTNEYGWIAYPYSYSKLNLYYQPKDIIVTSPFLKGTKTGRIGVNCEIVKILDDYFGLDDLVTRYATQLSNIDKAIDVALMNTNVAFMFAAPNKKDADTIKEAYAQATTGKPLVVLNKDSLGDNRIEPFFPSVSGNYIVDKLLQAKRTVLNEFCTKVGIRNANYDKKERLNSQEVSENNDETKSIISQIYLNIKQSFDKLTELGCTGLAIKYAYTYGEEEKANGTTDALRDV